MRGYRLARNAVAHGVIVAVVRRTGLVWPVTWPARWDGLDWASVDRVLEGVDRDDRQGEKTYRRWIAGTPVEPSLAGLLQFFEKILGR
jgi:hypothetical protein